MNEPLPPSSVDLTGDLSRNRPITSRTRHGEVGDPIGAPSYIPGKWPATEGTNVKATDCALVLRTLDHAGAEEYRIGRFKSLEQVDEGLRFSSDPAALNPRVARSCFGASPVLDSRAEAIGEAEKAYPRNAGIKILHMHCPFPV